MLKTALNKLVGVSPEVLIDKLGERLAFERTGTRLYDALRAVDFVHDHDPREVSDHFPIVVTLDLPEMAGTQ